MFEDLVPKAILIAIFLLVGFPIHEFAHAATAYALGDGTAKVFGRMSLNPLVHFDPLGGTMLVLSALLGGFVFGWAKPTPVNPANLRDRRNGEVLVALAGPASNLVMASLGAFVVRLVVALGVEVPSLVATVLILFVVYNVLLAVFNLIPIPPLDGSTLLFRILDPRTAWQVRPFLQQYGFLILLLVVFAGGGIISRFVFGVSRLLVGG
ncbi:MAG TPA: site-2 protease family protein [Candidatus Limnocylindrales bacterium]|nr:site-2 protease family protein [Candidatus Limnocylindrales bacterium]